MTNLLLTDDEIMLQTAVREFVAKELAPRSKEIDEAEYFSHENWTAMSKLGLAGIGIPTDLGGTGGGYREMCIGIEEVARGDASASVCLISHLSLGTHTINSFGNKNHLEKFVRPLAAGTKIAAWALTEPNTGSDASALETTAVMHGANYHVNGSKVFISNADVADIIIVFATQDSNKKAKGISAFIVEKGTPGLAINAQHGKLGVRGSTTAELIFNNTVVPKFNLLGEEGAGFHYAMEILDSSRIVIAAQCVGIAQSALDCSLNYAKQRRSFGKSISEHQAIQFMLADMATQIHVSRTATMHAATLKDKGLSHTKEAAMAKLVASEMALKVTSDAIQIHGGSGYFKPNPVERYFRDARITTIYEGSSEIQRLVIARQLLKGL